MRSDGQGRVPRRDRDGAVRQVECGSVECRLRQIAFPHALIPERGVTSDDERQIARRRREFSGGLFRRGHKRREEDAGVFCGVWMLNLERRGKHIVARTIQAGDHSRRGLWVPQAPGLRHCLQRRHWYHSLSCRHREALHRSQPDSESCKRPGPRDD